LTIEVIAVYLASSIKLRRFVAPMSASALAALLLSIGEDYRFGPLTAVDSARVNFRLDMSRSLSRHYYPREDYRTPAELVNERSTPEDIVITTAQPASLYLDRLNYLYRNRADGTFVGLGEAAGPDPWRQPGNPLASGTTSGRPMAIPVQRDQSGCNARVPKATAVVQQALHAKPREINGPR
jgi:hypothetical protein